jgi:hypothetical protein
MAIAAAAMMPRTEKDSRRIAQSAFR